MVEALLAASAVVDLQDNYGAFRASGGRGLTVLGFRVVGKGLGLRVWGFLIVLGVLGFRVYDKGLG